MGYLMIKKAPRRYKDISCRVTGTPNAAMTRKALNFQNTMAVSASLYLLI